ncbi:MAG: methyltransferase domain-containing protein [Acidobacteria bacterium]|nr:methyltransferase domain-containing protein [Acidobacteriota bacterium]
MTRGSGALRTFLASFLVLFLEVTLIRWMPAYIRLLSYFSNFILLASFLGIGVGCLLAPRRVRLFGFFPAILAATVAAVSVFRLEVAVPSTGSIYFASGTAEQVVVVESTMLLPILFVIVAALFATLAHRMAREMTTLPPLRAYTMNLAGSLAGVGVFAVMSWLELTPTVWFAVACAAALPLLALPEPDAPRRPATAALIAGFVLLASSLALVHALARGALWSPYYKITLQQVGADTVVEVNNIFHQSMAPVRHKEYFYVWPYTVFGDTFDDVLILGAGSGTDVAAALRHGARHVDAVEIDPAILRLGREKHPDRPYSDPRVTPIIDDARHFLRTTEKTYDLVVFALIDSLTLQSSFSGVRLESYMFTEEAFRAVRARLKPAGLLVVYNYFRERWLVDRLANTAAVAFGEEPYVHVHEARAYLGVLMAGPRLSRLPADLHVPDRVAAFGQSETPSPAKRHRRDASIEPATDDWPFLYLRDRRLPAHYVASLALILVVSAAAVLPIAGGRRGTWSWQFFLLGAGFMLLETKSIIQFALLWGSTWVVASLAIASVLTMALVANAVVASRDIRRPWLVGGVLLALLAANFVIPIGRVGFQSRAAESIFDALLVFSPVLCAGLLFGSAFKRSTTLARDFGTNLLGAMVGGVAEYLSLVTGFRALLIAIAMCYVGALGARRLDFSAYRDQS